MKTFQCIQFPCSHKQSRNLLLGHGNNIIKIEYKFQIQRFERLISYRVDDGGQPSVEPITEYRFTGNGPLTDPFNPFCEQCESQNISLIMSLGHGEDCAKKYLGELKDNILDKLRFNEEVKPCYDWDLPYLVDSLCNDEEQLRAWVERFSFEEEVAKPIPATKESIEVLPRSVIKNYETTSCAVCLEELYNGNKKGGLKVTMPCKHEFHEGCIVEWLRTSHICPLCRFELPMEEVDVDDDDED